MAKGVRKFQVRLSAHERQELEALVREHTAPNATCRRARVLLLADVASPEGRRTDATIAELVGLSERHVKRLRQRFVKERDEDESVRGLCQRRPHPPAPERRRLNGEAEAQLVTLACSTPPNGRDRWTLRLLCDELERLEIVESICPETVRTALKKTS